MLMLGLVQGLSTRSVNPYIAPQQHSPEGQPGESGFRLADLFYILQYMLTR